MLTTNSKIKKMLNGLHFIPLMKMMIKLVFQFKRKIRKSLVMSKTIPSNKAQMNMILVKLKTNHASFNFSFGRNGISYKVYQTQSIRFPQSLIRSRMNSKTRY